MGNDASVGLNIKNTGQRTYLDLTVFDNSEVIFQPVFQHVAEASDTLVIIAKKKTEKLMVDCNYTIQLYHSDVYGNEYLTELLHATGGGVINSFNTFEELKDQNNRNNFLSRR